ncbi:hypothetical protein VP01_1256g3 [Puccinia sorghi]|uniref:Uncharacterized protein n=1 Tax=Puccinia sorghi TaxID=27349 RepID=A0A0L6VPJ3_9BASI|nr:hypothetical protein VP01_1256g3 [Puccinia sorghi]
MVRVRLGWLEGECGRRSGRWERSRRQQCATHSLSCLSLISARPLTYHKSHPGGSLRRCVTLRGDLPAGRHFGITCHIFVYQFEFRGCRVSWLVKSFYQFFPIKMGPSHPQSSILDFAMKNHHFFWGVKRFTPSMAWISSLAMNILSPCRKLKWLIHGHPIPAFTFSLHQCFLKIQINGPITCQWVLKMCKNICYNLPLLRRASRRYAGALWAALFKRLSYTNHRILFQCLCTATSQLIPTPKKRAQASNIFTQWPHFQGTQSGKILNPAQNQKFWHSSYRAIISKIKIRRAIIILREPTPSNYEDSHRFPLQLNQLLSLILRLDHNLILRHRTFSQGNMYFESETTYSTHSYLSYLQTEEMSEARGRVVIEELLVKLKNTTREPFQDPKGACEENMKRTGTEVRRQVRSGKLSQTGKQEGGMCEQTT